MNLGISDEAILQRSIALAQLERAEVSFQKIVLERARGLTVQGRLANGDVFTRILVDPEETTYRKAFIICHELGHIALHTGYGNLLELDWAARERLEREANWFATRLMYKIRLRLLLQSVLSIISPGRR